MHTDDFRFVMSLTLFAFSRAFHDAQLDDASPPTDLHRIQWEDRGERTDVQCNPPHSDTVTPAMQS
eukprot:5570136-Amphidinium_carterae.1